MSDSAPAIPIAREPCSVACCALWLVGGVMLLLVCAWPLLAGMVAANDDIGFVRDDRYTGTLLQSVVASWQKASVFRPLDVIAGRLCDVQTLECRSVMAIQIAGLIAMVSGLAVLLRRLMPQQRLGLPLLVIWLMLSPATTVSLWQLDSCSQTWSAACGIWMGLLTWMALDAARTGRALWPWIAGLSTASLVVVNVKELMYGWFFGIGLVVLAVIARHALKRDWRTTMRCAWLTLPVILLPIAHLTVRLKFSALAQTLEPGVEGESEARYQATLGLNVLSNAWVSLLGLFGNGPLHLVTDGDAAPLLRVLPVASLVAVFVALVASAVIATMHGAASGVGRPQRVVLGLCAAAGLLSVSVTLPMGSVSELYGMGANAASGLLVVTALLALWNPARGEDRALCRLIAFTCAAIITIVGVYGVVSRAYHFRLTWLYAREMSRTLLGHQRVVQPADQPFLALIGQQCIPPRLHSQYVISPLQAVGYPGTGDWMNREDPSRQVMFVLLTPMSKPGPRDLVLRCDDLPMRGHW